MSDINLLHKINDYEQEHCYQYQRRLDTIEEDKIVHNMSDEDIANISLDDFVFKNITSKEDKAKATEFIKRYEWLGTIGSYPTQKYKRCTERQAKYLDIFDVETQAIIENPNKIRQ